MDPGLESLLNDPRIKRNFSLSLGGVAEGLAQVAPPVLVFYLVGTRVLGDGMTVIALALLLALPLFLISRSRSGSALVGLRKALTLAVVNLLAAGVGFLIHALPNFFFA